MWDIAFKNIFKVIKYPSTHMYTADSCLLVDPPLSLPVKHLRLWALEGSIWPVKASLAGDLGKQQQTWDQQNLPSRRRCHTCIPSRATHPVGLRSLLSKTRGSEWDPAADSSECHMSTSADRKPPQRPPLYPVTLAGHTLKQTPNHLITLLETSVSFQVSNSPLKRRQGCNLKENHIRCV